jgi:hypothetical protein
MAAVVSPNRDQHAATDPYQPGFNGIARTAGIGALNRCINRVALEKLKRDSGLHTAEKQDHRG